MRYLKLILSFILLLVIAVDSKSQEAVYDMTPPMVMSKLSGYIENVAAIENEIGSANKKELDVLELKLETVNFRVESFFSTEQWQITNNEDLMALMEVYKEMHKSTTDSIVHCRERISTINEFKKAENEISNAVDDFTKFHEDATKYSLTKHTASELEKVKAVSQQEFLSLKELHQKAKDAASKYPELTARMKELDEIMLEIQIKSDSVFAMEYVPFVQRIKDYLLSIAAVAIIVMLLTSVKSRIQAAKAMKENAKKLQQQLENEEYPEI